MNSHDLGSDIAAVNEYVLALVRGDIKLRPITKAAGRLFQARMWREYAMAWDGHVRRHGAPIDRKWVEGILRISRTECLRRARVNLYLARRLNRSPSPIPTPPTTEEEGA